MTTVVNIRVENVASGIAQKDLKNTIGDMFAQTAIIKALRKALIRRHGKETFQNSWRGVLGEFFGMIFLVLVGCGSTVASNYFLDDAVAKLIFTAGTGGYLIYVLVASLLKISGGHLNPAVTTAILITRNIGIIKGLVYILVQVAGSIVASAILWGLTPTSIRGSFCVNRRNLSRPRCSLKHKYSNANI
jgi:O-antigen/teichoic acid export membrane protein